ncbi:MAG: hypothetical protein ACTSWN_10475 [Promethearchaeota archaeon]
MSFWSRIFSRKQLETIELVRKELNTLFKKSDASFIGLAGLSGKIKGMDIITVHDEKRKEFFIKKELKRYIAKGVEILLRFQALGFSPPENTQDLKFINIHYKRDFQFHLIPIPNNPFFALITMNCQPLKIFNNWKKLLIYLEKLIPTQHGKNEE